MNSTLHSECCWVPKKILPETPTGLVNVNMSYYKNNLNAPNWFYGNIKEQDYKYKIFSRATKYNLTNCPIETPYVLEENNICFPCDPKGAYNLGTKKCVNCAKGEHFNRTEKKCGKCDETYILNETLYECVPECPEG